MPRRLRVTTHSLAVRSCAKTERTHEGSDRTATAHSLCWFRRQCSLHAKELLRHRCRAVSLWYIFPRDEMKRELQAAEAIRCNDNSLRPCDVAGPGRHTMRDAPAPRRAAPAAFALWCPGWWCFAYERGADRLDLDGRCLADSTHMIMGSPLKWGRVSSVPLPWWPAFFFFEKITGTSRYCFPRNPRWAGGLHAFQSGQRTWTWDR